MRFLGVTETCDLGALYLELLRDGHEVRIHVSEPGAQGTMAGLVPQVVDWRAQLPWIREAGDDGVILFESVSEGFGASQDDLRRDGFNVVGGSAFGDRLENDRAYGQALLASVGMATAGVWSFTDAQAADRFIADNPARYVLKFSGPDFASSDNYIGQLADGRDVRAVMAAKLRTLGDDGVSFILMEHIDGVEMGVGAYFDGTRFLRPACLDWEHKRFFAGDLGELTGEMGTVATYQRSDRFFDLTLAKMEPFFRQHGHVGYVNLNTIVNARGIWPLEFTCRFGYPGFAVLTPLQATPWALLLKTMATGAQSGIEVHPGFSVGVLLSTPPFPYTRKQIDEPVGLPILFDAGFSEADRRHVHYGEVGLDGEALVTSGLYGWTMVVTGQAASVASAQAQAYERARRIHIPNVRYRLDIGERLIGGDYAWLEAWGLLSD